MISEDDIIPLNPEQWEEREPTDEELSRITVLRLKRRMRTQRFWAIKRKSNARFTRSLNYQYNLDSDQTENETYFTEGSFKLQWSNFILDLMKISTEDIIQDIAPLS